MRIRAFHYPHPWGTAASNLFLKSDGRALRAWGISGPNRVRSRSELGGTGAVVLGACMVVL